MRKIFFKVLFLFGMALSISGCQLAGLDMQEDYDYKPVTLDPNIYKSARQFLEERSYGTSPNDTVFKWMRLGMEYAGIDLAEFEKSDRTFIFLHNNAIRTLDSKGKVTGGMWFTFPIVVKENGVPKKDAAGNVITTPATKWSDYTNKEDVKNYFLYLITLGRHNFGDLSVNNKTVQTLLPPNSKASTVSRLGYIVTPATSPTTYTVDYVNGGTGFDQEGKMNLKIANTDLTPIQMNDRHNNRTAGYVATNGIIHVYDTAIWPFR